MAATLGWSNGNLIFIEACHRDDQHNVMLCVSASMRQSEVLQAKRPAVLLFLHAGVLLRVKQKRVHVTGHKGLLGCNAEHSERSLCKKSLQNLTAMQLGRLIVGIGMLQAAKTRHYHYHPHTQWLRLPSSAWRTPLSHMHVATSPWIQDKVFTTSGSRAMAVRCAATNEVPRIQRVHGGGGLSSAGSSHVLRSKVPGRRPPARRPFAAHVSSRAGASCD
jgi:hypothetical protein